MQTDDNRRDDDFRGDNEALVRSIDALLDLDDAKALVPHGVGDPGSHAYRLLACAASRLRSDRDPAEVENERLREAILAVVAATRAYLPPDGISAQECISRVLAATDNPTINPIILEAE